MNEKGLSCIEVLIVGVIIFTLGSVIAAPFIRFSQVTTGSHTGFVTAVDKRGWIWANYEVFFKTDNQSSQEDTYCVDRRNVELGDKLTKLKDERKLVTIKYKGVRGLGIDLCQGTEITDVVEK